MDRVAGQADAVAAFVVTVAVLVWVIFAVWYSPEAGGWVVDWRPGPEVREAQGLRAVAWPLYPLLGVAVTLVVGGALSLRHRGGAGADPAALAS